MSSVVAVVLEPLDGEGTAGSSLCSILNISGFSEVGVSGRLEFLGGPSGASSALRLDRSTLSRKLIAASKFVRQYAASPSILLRVRNR